MIERIKSHEDWSNDAAIWNSAKTITGVIGVSSLTIISNYENFAIWHRDINLTRSVGLWSIGSGFSSSSIWIEAIRVLVVINRDFTVFHHNAFTWKSNNTFDDLLVFNGRVDITSELTTGLTIEKDDDLSTFWYIFLTR